MSSAGTPLLTTASAHALELPALLRLVAELTASDLGRQRVLALGPCRDEADLRRRRGRLEETSLLVAERPLVPQQDEPLVPLLERLATGRPPLDGRDLLRLAELLTVTQEARQRILGSEPSSAALGEDASALPDLTPLLRRIQATLDRRGDVRDDASAELGELRRSIRRLRDRLYNDLQRFVAKHREHLSEETIPLREGRLILLLQAGARGKARGLIHGRSATGRSFYFEPLEAVEPNNELQQAAAEAEAERRRIFEALVRSLRQALPDLETHAAFLADLDLLQAAARFAKVSRGTLPEIASDGELRLASARHPLLDPELAELRRAALGQPGHLGEIVPLDVELSARQRALVVTGPNAGGKTVALKTVGLLCLASQCGLPVPVAAASRIPLFSHLVATVGDEQDLLADRSTFSGRLLRLKEAWDLADARSLVLLDELGSGTDPEEGAALAISLLEGLLERRSLALLTTHLTPLAAAGLQLEGAGCAAMEFDPATGEPTFRLLPGPPGASEALALARRLGLPAEWLDRAEAHLGEAQRKLRHLLAEVEAARRETIAIRSQLDDELRQTTHLRQDLEREREELHQERRQIASRLKAELRAFRDGVQQRLRQEVERLRRELEEGRRRGVVSAAVERLFADVPGALGEEETDAGPLRVGGRVRHRALGWEGILQKLEGDRAEVGVAGKRVVCRHGELTAAAEPQRETAPTGSVAGPSQSEDVPRELKLIGRRVEPALAALDDYLDRALLASHADVRVIHGHGTGRLRQAVREHLRSHPAVADFRPGKPHEGGEGATVVVLKER